MTKILCILTLFAGLSTFTHAQSVQKFHPKATLGDGKDGRVFHNFTANLREAPVNEVIANVILVSGSGVYVNARFGDGSTLEGGKRIPVTSNKRTQIKWNVGGVPPNGKPLTIKAYNGEVKLLFVQVNSRK